MKDRNKHITELQETAECLRVRIEEARGELEGEPLTIEYDHGGGQSGTRENPAWTSFEKMVKSYQAVIKQLAELTKDDTVKEQSKSNLRIVGNSKWKKQA